MRLKMALNLWYVKLSEKSYKIAPPRGEMNLTGYLRGMGETMTQCWYDDCPDGYPWWRITGQAYRKYFTISEDGIVLDLVQAIREDLVCVGAGEIARQLGITPRAVAYRAKRLGFRFVGLRNRGRWIAPEEAA